MSPQVTVLSTGGTIATKQRADIGEPVRTGKNLVDSVPDLRGYAELSVEQVAQVGSTALGFETLETLEERVRVADDADDVDGVVVTHGTSTMEETAYYLDLVLDVDVPVALTGSMRRSDEPGPDGPANLLAATRTVVDPDVRSAGGVYVVANDEVHAARDVTKAHTTKVETFSSPNTGPIGVFYDSLRLLRDPGSRSVSIPDEGVDSRVEIVPSPLGADDAPVRRAVDDVDGFVVEGTGLGSATPALGDAIRDAIDAGVPVVMTTRCHAGPVAPLSDSHSGGLKLLEAAGVVPGDDLPAHKARLKLKLALGHASDPEHVRRVFTDGTASGTE